MTAENIKTTATNNTLQPLRYDLLGESVLCLLKKPLTHCSTVNWSGLPLLILSVYYQLSYLPYMNADFANLCHLPFHAAVFGMVMCFSPSHSHSFLHM